MLLDSQKNLYLTKNHKYLCILSAIQLPNIYKFLKKEEKNSFSLKVITNANFGFQFVLNVLTRYQNFKIITLYKKLLLLFMTSSKKLQIYEL